MTPVAWPLIDRTQDVAETVQRRSPTPLIDVVGPGRSETHLFSNWPILITRSWYRRRHLNLEVLKVFGLSCHALSGHNTWCGVHILLVSFWRNAMSCTVTSCTIKPHHGHVSQGAAKTRCGGVLQASKCQWRALHLQLRTRSVQSGSDTVMIQGSGSLCYT